MGWGLRDARMCVGVGVLWFSLKEWQCKSFGISMVKRLQLFLSKACWGWCGGVIMGWRGSLERRRGPKKFVTSSWGFRSVRPKFKLGHVHVKNCTRAGKSIYYWVVGSILALWLCAKSKLCFLTRHTRGSWKVLKSTKERKIFFDYFLNAWEVIGKIDWLLD